MKLPRLHKEACSLLAQRDDQYSCVDIYLIAAVGILARDPQLETHPFPFHSTPGVVWLDSDIVGN